MRPGTRRVRRRGLLLRKAASVALAGALAASCVPGMALATTAPDESGEEAEALQEASAATSTSCAQLEVQMPERDASADSMATEATEAGPASLNAASEGAQEAAAPSVDARQVPEVVEAALMTEAAEATSVSEPATTRRDLLNGSYINLMTPNADGAAAGKFLATDRNATAQVTLHPEVPSATFAVVAWPKSVDFGSDYVDSDDITRFGTRLFTQFNVKDGDVVNITFNDAAFASISDPTAYAIIAYLQFSDTTTSDGWPIVKPTAAFPIVNEDGESFASYEFPDATIVEESLPVGAAALHLNVTGDERLFQIARDSRGTSSSLQIHVTVVEYDASVTPATYDFEETEQVRLYSADIYEPLANQEIQLSQPLTEGKRVRALVYTTQYLGSLAPNPIPASHDYTADRPDDSVLVRADAPPIVLSPAVSIQGSIATDSTELQVTIANPPEGSMLMVKRYVPGEEIITQNGDYAGGMSAAAGTHSVPLLSTVQLSANDRIVAFIMSGGQVSAQSSVTTVTSAQAQSDIFIVGPVSKTDAAVTVVVNCDIPADAHISLRQFSEPKNTEWGSQNSIGSVQNPVVGENAVSISGLRRDYVVAFLATDYGTTIYAASDPIKVEHEAAAPTVSIAPADVAFTEGDLYLNMTWSADEHAKDVSYRLYQYEGVEFDVDTAETIASGFLSNSTTHAGTMGVSVSKPLKAGCTVRMVIAADELSATSNPLSVGAKPEWATATPQVSFGQDAIHVSDRTVTVNADYAADYEELGSEYFCVVSVYQISASLVQSGYTDEDLEDMPVASLFYNDMRKDQTRGELLMSISSSVQLEEGNYLAIKLRLPDPIRQDSQAMWRDYVSSPIPIIADDGDGGEGGDGEGSGSETGAPSVQIMGTVTTESTTVPVELSGEVSPTALLLMKAFQPGEPIAYDNGNAIPLGITFGAAAHSSLELTPTSALSELPAGSRLVVFMLDAGDVVTQSQAVEIKDAQADVPVADPVKVLLYNLGADTARGAQVRSILTGLGVDVETITATDLGQTVGYLVGLPGYVAAEGSSWGPSTGAASAEFMLMCGFDEPLLDAFLDEMQAQSLRIDHKAILTPYNRDYTLGQLIGDIADEHEMFQALLALDKAIAEAQELDVNAYGAHAQWAALQEAIAAGNALLGSDEPATEDLLAARQSIVDLMAAVTAPVPPEEEVTPSVPSGPAVVPGVPAEPSESAAANGTRPSVQVPVSGPVLTSAGVVKTLLVGRDAAALPVNVEVDETSEVSEGANVAGDGTSVSVQNTDVQRSIADDETPLADEPANDAQGFDWVPVAIGAALVLTAAGIVVWRRKRSHA